MTDRDSITQSIIGELDNCRVRTRVPVPRITYKSLGTNRMLCRQNRCGNYNRSWTCPPNCGSEEYCIERVSSYRDADVVIQTFSDVDFSDSAYVERILTEFRETCRKVMIGCREAGFDVMALADGPCSYCKVCAAESGKKCMHPEMQVPSVSGYGVNMTEYIAEIGEKFEFAKDRATFYGIILFR